MRKNIKEAGCNRQPRGFKYEELPSGIGVFVRKGYTVVKCDGSAHSNPHIDHCMLCLNHIWGWRAVPESEQPE